MMNHRNNPGYGLSALGLGVVGGMLLWWGLRRRPSKNVRATIPYRPMELELRRDPGTFGAETRPQGRVTASIAETAWPEVAAASPAGSGWSRESAERSLAKLESEGTAASVTASIAETAWLEGNRASEGLAESSRSSPDYEEAAAPATEFDEATTTAETAAAPAEPQEASTPEDLTPIEGIGPKINKVLHEAGITTFAQLAETEVGRLQQILSEANIPLANADTWPEQASLAAAGDWEELKRLQNELDAGVRRSR